MTDAIYKTGTKKVDHRTFGGKIYESDFNTNFSGKKNLRRSSIAERIAEDERFDNFCKRNRETNTKQTF